MNEQTLFNNLLYRYKQQPNTLKSAWVWVIDNTKEGTEYKKQSDADYREAMKFLSQLQAVSSGCFSNHSR